MPSIEIIIFMLVIIVAFSAIVERLKIPQSVMLVIVGLVIGFTPQLPDVILKPDTVFLIFLPPLLFTAAWKLSWHDFKAQRRPVISLATGLVFFTMVAVAAVAHYFIPGFSWQLGFVLGAVVSPPDAVAASSVTKGLNLNKRIIIILEGESLLNDASALVAYRYAIASVVTGGFIFWHASLQFVLVAIGGTIAGLLVAWALSWANKRIRNNSTIVVALTILTPYVAYLLAEHFHFSGVLAVVAAGLFVSFRAPEVFSYQTRMQANSFWETIEFLLNGFVFILIGMQLPGIVANLEKDSLLSALGYGFLITSVAIVVRIIWVFPAAYLPQLLSRGETRQREKINWRNVLVISWAGMRGVVSLASALAIPLTLADGAAFPQRDMILFITFCVIFFTLVVHGLSLRLVVKLLKVSADDILLMQEENKIRKQLAAGSLSYINDQIVPQGLDEKVITRLKNKYETQLKLVSNRNSRTPLGSSNAGAVLLQYTQAQKAVLDFEREALILMHKEDAASSDIIKKLEFELDIEESRLSELLKRVQ